MTRRDPFARLCKVYDYILEKSQSWPATDFFVLDVHDEKLRVNIWKGVYKDVSVILGIPAGQVSSSFSHLVKLECIRSLGQGVWQIGQAPNKSLWDAIQSRDLASGKFRPNNRVDRALDSTHKLRTDLEELRAKVARLEYIVYANHAARDSTGND